MGLGLCVDCLCRRRRYGGGGSGCCSVKEHRFRVGEVFVGGRIVSCDGACSTRDIARKK